MEMNIPSPPLVYAKASLFQKQRLRNCSEKLQNKNQKSYCANIIIILKAVLKWNPNFTSLHEKNKTFYHSKSAESSPKISIQKVWHQGSVHIATTWDST